MDLLKPLLPHIDFFMPSMEEAEFLSGFKEPGDIAKYFLDLGVGSCIFKWGDMGSFITTRDSSVRMPAFKVDVVDTTGCGDVFHGAYAPGLAFGMGILACFMYSDFTFFSSLLA